MPRVLARRAAGGENANQVEEVEWVEWPDEPRHEVLFDLPEPLSDQEDGQQPGGAAPALAARAYAAFFEKGGERFTLFHRHRHDTAYICASAAADDASDADVWNQELKELEPPSRGGGGSPSSSPPTHELLAPARVHHTTGMCFCNPHRTRDGGAYVHRLRYAASNPRDLHFVGVEVRPRTIPATTETAPSPPPLPQVPGPHLALKLEYEQPGLFRAWRLAMDGGAAAGEAGVAGGDKPATTTTVALGGGFGGRGGAVVLIKPLDWSKVAYDCDGNATAGPFGTAARARARGAGGWSGAAGGGGGGDGASGVFPAGGAWPLLPEDGRAPFSLAPKDPEDAVLEAMLVEFL